MVRAALGLPTSSSATSEVANGKSKKRGRAGGSNGGAGARARAGSSRDAHEAPNGRRGLSRNAATMDRSKFVELDDGDDGDDGDDDDDDGDDDEMDSDYSDEDDEVEDSDEDDDDDDYDDDDDDDDDDDEMGSDEKGSDEMGRDDSDVDDENSAEDHAIQVPSGLLHKTFDVREKAKGAKVIAVNNVDLTEEGAAAPLSVTQAEQVVATMDAMRRAKKTAAAVVHGWHLSVSVRPQGGRCDMQAIPRLTPRRGLRIASMVELRKHLGLAPLRQRTLSALATLAPTRVASTGQLTAAPFIAPKHNMASLGEDAFRGLQPPQPPPPRIHQMLQGGAWMDYNSFVIEGKPYRSHVDDDPNFWMLSHIAFPADGSNLYNLKTGYFHSDGQYSKSWYPVVLASNGTKFLIHRRCL